MLKTRTGGFGGDEESKEGSLGHNEDKIGNLARDSADSGRYALADYKKGKKGKKAEVHHSEATLFDDIREAYKYADKGPRRNGSDGKGAKICKSTSEGERKRSKKLTFEGRYTLLYRGLCLSFSSFWFGIEGKIARDRELFY